MTQTNARDLRRHHDDPTEAQRQSPLADTLPMVILAAVLAAIVLVMAYQQPATERAGDTNAGPSVRTVTPAPSPSTSPAVPTPNPTTEQPNTPPAQ
jgi:hypothetical protein